MYVLRILIAYALIGNGPQPNPTKDFYRSFIKMSILTVGNTMRQKYKLPKLFIKNSYSHYVTISCYLQILTSKLYSAGKLRTAHGRKKVIAQACYVLR